jgi:hypothetical protein
MMHTRLFSFIPALLYLTMTAQTASAQVSVIIGRVVGDSGVALVGAEIFLNGPQNVQRSNDKGEFTFSRVPAGFQIIGVRMTGYAPRVDTIEVEDAGEIRREFRLSRIETTLPKVPVTTTMLDKKLAEFYERRKTLGAGRFLDSAEFANTRGTRMSDRLSKLPGVLIQRGIGSQVFITNTRIRRPGEPGSKSMCRSLVWMDGVNLGVEFNVNELNPSHVAAVEWYAGEFVPAKLTAQPRFSSNATVPAPGMAKSNPAIPQGYCGVLVIWLR